MNILVEVMSLVGKPVKLTLSDGKEISGIVEDYGSLFILFLEDHNQEPRLLPLNKISEVKQNG